ncbi:MAG: FAD-dependent oxidoreductase, partial [Saprospiraceae bacterium]
GVRYLEQAFKNLDFGQLRQVRHGLEERHLLLANAPQLAHPLAILTPVFNWWTGLYLRIGLWLYDCFAARKDALPASRWLSRAEALGRMPGLSPDIHSAVLYYDGQLDDARYALAIVQSAAAAGAVVANHLEVLAFQKDAAGKLQSVSLHDDLTGESFPLRARLFLNCTGPGADAVRQLANPALANRIRPSKGVHVVLPATVLGSSDAMLIPKTPDGRMVFAIPFEGRLLLGTTDQDYTRIDQEPVLEEAEAEFLLRTLQPFVREKLHKERVKAGFGGLRPLITGHSGAAFHSLTKQTKATKRMLRDHEVEHDPVSGLLSLLGGKWTTYRLMARDAVDAAGALLDWSAPCSTAGHRLTGATGFTVDGWQNLVHDYGFDPAIAQHLHHNYGSQASRVGDLIRIEPAWAERLHADFPFIRAEVVYAARNEMACSLRDFLARRIRLEILDWEAVQQVIPVVAGLLGQELGWTSTEVLESARRYNTLVQDFKNHLPSNLFSNHDDQ